MCAFPATAAAVCVCVVSLSLSLVVVPGRYLPPTSPHLLNAQKSVVSWCIISLSRSLAPSIPSLHVNVVGIMYRILSASKIKNRHKSERERERDDDDDDDDDDGVTVICNDVM